MNAHTRNIRITSEYITLGQLLKFADIVSSGSEAKIFLQENEILVNGVPDNRRGRKLRDGDVVEIKSEKIVIKQ